MNPAIPPPSRRQLLQSLLAGGIAGAPASAASAALTSRRRLLNIVFPNPSSARAVGLTCLRAGVPPRPWATLEASLANGSGLELMQDAQIVAAVDSRLRADFAAGALVVVDGWMLSRTEVDLFVLAAGMS